jgi:hypothetical protein
MSPDLWVAYTIALAVYSLTLLPALHLKNNNSPQDDNERGDAVAPEETQPLLDTGNNSAREVIHLNQSGGRGLSQKLKTFTICFACFFGFYLAKGSMNYTFIWVWAQFGHDLLYVRLDPQRLFDTC